MSPAFGLSSGSLPGSSVDDLVRTCRRHGATTLDLRVGKGHAWETGGAVRALAAVADAGLTVAFVGLGWVLGDPDAPLSGDEASWAPALSGHAVKAFAARTPDPALLRRQVADAGRAGCRVLVETHRGGPAPGRLRELAESTGVGVVADSLGLLECSDTPVTDDLAGLAPHVAAIQVKGVEGPPTARRHRPLALADLALVEDLRTNGAPVGSLTLESRAGAVDDDLELIAGFLANHADGKAGG